MCNFKELKAHLMDGSVSSQTFYIAYLFHMITAYLIIIDNMLNDG